MGPTAVYPVHPRHARVTFERGKPPPPVRGAGGPTRRKPSSVPDDGHPSSGRDHSSRVHVTGDLERPTQRHERTALGTSLFGLAPSGVYLAAPVTRDAGALLPHPFNLAGTNAPCPPPIALPLGMAIGSRQKPRFYPGPGGLLSVALSSGSPRPGVTRHSVLWSSDFPPAGEPAGDLLPASDGQRVSR